MNDKVEFRPVKQRRCYWRLGGVAVAIMCTLLTGVRADELRVATFEIDATPPIGSALCNGLVTPAKQIVTPLSGRGIVLLGAGEPIVLCALDWVAVANETHEVMRAELAKAVGTSADRVTVHTLHQHDAPGSDFATERLLAEHGLPGVYSNPEFDRAVVQRLATAAKTALATAQPVTHVGLGVGVVEKVASNRRILGPTGKVVIQRNSSAGRNPAAQAAPEGTIDPKLRLISFWQKDRPLVALSYYATHPQSYYGKGGVSWDFVGMARKLREESLPGVKHIHFNGAGGNVAAGKYNNGAPEMRPELARRLAEGMNAAWTSQSKMPIRAAEVKWHVEPVAIPVRETMKAAQLESVLKDSTRDKPMRIRAARDLTFLRRMESGWRTPLTCLQLGSARVLHMPGELFVEYQLAAQDMRPKDFVAMAAYGDQGPGYVGTAVAYSQGGYETGIVSRVGPPVEKVLTDGMRKLLER